MKLDMSGPFARLANMPTAEKVAQRYGEGYYTDEWLAKEKQEYFDGLWHVPFLYRSSLLEPYDTLLDWGCGTGWFVRWCDGHGAKFVQGYDPYPFRQNDLACPMVRPDEESIWLSAYKLGGFDAIHLALVLEHVPDPEQLLRTLRAKYLKPKGKLLVIVPNEFNPLQNRLARKWGQWYISQDHLNYFTGPTLHDLLDRTGYQVTHMGSTFPTELFSLIGDYRNTDLGKQCFRAHLKFQRFVGPRCFSWYAWLFRKWAIGRELLFVAEAR